MVEEFLYTAIANGVEQMAPLRLHDTYKISKREIAAITQITGPIKANCRILARKTMLAAYIYTLVLRLYYTAQVSCVMVQFAANVS